MDIDLTEIKNTFADADLSIIKEVLYFNGWMSYEECGGYLIFIGIDDTIQLCDYGYCVFAEDNTNYFLPREITPEESAVLMKEMDTAAQESSVFM